MRRDVRLRVVVSVANDVSGSNLDETRRRARGVPSRARTERFARAYASSPSSSLGAVSADAPRRVKKGGTSAEPSVPTAPTARATGAASAAGTETTETKPNTPAAPVRAPTTIPVAPVSSTPPTRSSPSINASTTTTRPSAIPDTSAETTKRAT